MGLDFGHRRIGLSLTRTVNVADYEPLKVAVWDERIVLDDENVGKEKTRLARSLLKQLNLRIREAVEDQFGRDALQNLEF